NRSVAEPERNEVGNRERRPLLALGLAWVFTAFGLLQYGIGARTRLVWLPRAAVNADRISLALTAPFVSDDVSLAAVSRDANAKSSNFIVPQTNACDFVGRTSQSLDRAHADARMYCLLCHV